MRPYMHTWQARVCTEVSDRMFGPNVSVDKSHSVTTLKRPFIACVVTVRRPTDDLHIVFLFSKVFSCFSEAYEPDESLHNNIIEMFYPCCCGVRTISLMLKHLSRVVNLVELDTCSQCSLVC